MQFYLTAYPDLDINSTHESGVWTALHEACDFGHREAFQEIAKFRGIDMNKQDRDGRSGLFWAAFRGRNLIVWDLVRDPRVDVNLPNYRGETPLWKAVSCGHTQVVKYILAAPVVVDVTARPKMDTEISPFQASVMAENMGDSSLQALLEAYEQNPDFVKFKLRSELGLTGEFLDHFFNALSSSLTFFFSICQIRLWLRPLLWWCSCATTTFSSKRVWISCSLL